MAWPYPYEELGKIDFIALVRLLIAVTPCWSEVRIFVRPAPDCPIFELLLLPLLMLLDTEFYNDY